jgi:hypothetical protein
MMTDVACFCGCRYSFGGGAGTCPKCGEVATVTADPALESPGGSQPRHLVPVMNGAGRNGQAPGTCPELAEADTLSGITIGTAGHDPRTARERGRLTATLRFPEH